MLKLRSEVTDSTAILYFTTCWTQIRSWIRPEMAEDDRMSANRDGLVVSLYEMSLKSRTETSANWWQEMEGGCHHQHTYLSTSALTLLRNASNQRLKNRLIPLVTIRGFDESPRVIQIVHASI